MIWILAVILLLVAALFVVDNIIAAPKYVEGTSNHFDGKHFVNPNEVGNHSYLEVLKWWFSGNDKGDWPVFLPEDVEEPSPPRKLADGELQVTFINHACFLLQFDGLNILTDPIWSERASPFGWIGPKRKRPPGIKFEDLPPIDAVLISHNHYDHLDLASVQRLHREHDPEFIVPLGVEQYLNGHEIYNTVQLDWWDSYSTPEGLSLTAVPARHFSGRGVFDRNTTLWCGYVLHSSVGNMYFAGDTGYGDFFKKIDRKFGPIHTSIIPIGAYLPRWFMSPIHLSPQEAVQVHRDVRSGQSFAMHFGTFPLADDGMFDGVLALRKELEEHGLEDEFHILKEGEGRVINNGELRMKNEEPSPTRCHN